MLDRTTPPPVRFMDHLYLPLPLTQTLPNGIKFYKIEGGSQEVMQLSLTWQGGLSEAPQSMVAKLMASLMLEGTARRSGAEIAEALDFHGAMLKVEAASHTTILQLTVINSMAADILPIVREVICEAAFPQEAFDAIHEIELRNFLLSRARVTTLCYEAFDVLIKGSSHPEAAVPTVEALQAITAEEVRRFYSQVITSDGCCAYLGGRFSDDMCQRVMEMLSSLPSVCPAMPKKIIPYTAMDPATVVVEKPGAVQAALTMGIPAMPRSHPHYLPLRLTVMALGGYFGSRLMKNIREDKGYTYGISAHLLGNQEGSYIMVSAQADASYVELVVEEVKTEMLKLAQEPMEADELQRLRQHVASSLLETLDSPFSIIDHYKVIETVGLPEGYFDNQVMWVKKITPEVIMDMAREYILPSQLRIAVCK